MSKDYTALTPEICASKNGKCTLSFTPFLELGKENEFNSIISKGSYIKLKLNDFSKGRGEGKQIVVDYNISYDVFLVLANCISTSTFSGWTDCKVLKKHPESNGEFSGMFKVRKIVIEYIQGNRVPWKIAITNGYSKDDKGVLSAGVKSTQMFMSDMELKRIFMLSALHINLFYYTFGPDKMLAGLKKYAENTRGNRYEVETSINNESECDYEESNAYEQPTQNGSYIITCRIISVQEPCNNVYRTAIAWDDGKQAYMYHTNPALELEQARQGGYAVRCRCEDYMGYMFYTGLAV